MSALGTLAQTAIAKDAFQSTLIRRSKSSSLSTWDVATTNRNAVITSRLVITLSRTRLRKKSYTPIKEAQPVATSYIDSDIVKQSLRGYPANKLFQFLSAQFGETETLKLMKKYKVGTSKYWDGATVFWQTDNQNKVRTGEIMLYNPETG